MLQPSTIGIVNARVALRSSAIRGILAHVKVLAVAAAIALVAPSIPAARRSELAKLIVFEAARAKVDPVLVVAIVEHESRWRRRARSKDGEDYGLGQIRARFLPECAKPSSLVCRRTKRRLLSDAEFNLRRTIEILGKWRSLCRTETNAMIGYAAGRCSVPIPRAVAEILELRSRLRQKLPPA